MNGIDTMKQIRVGDIVPEIELAIYDPKVERFGRISLAELTQSGRWIILFFYPADFSPVCPTELADVAELYEKIVAVGAEVISISRDTIYTHFAWHHTEKLLENVRFPMASDPTGNVARLFGVYDETSGLALRGTFIISPERKLVASEVNLYNVGRNAEEILRKLEANVYLSHHPDEACPAKWKKGNKTLKPTEKMIGKVYEALRG